MSKILIVLLFFIFQGCAFNKCLTDNAIYLRFKEGFKDRKHLSPNKEDVALLEKEEKVQDKLFSKICNQLQENASAIIIEKVPFFNTERFGIVYLVEKNQLIYFSHDKMGNVDLGKREYGYEALEKVLFVIKTDFHSKMAHLSGFFNKKVVFDAASLNLILIDPNNAGKTEMFYSLKYLPELIMSKEFDDEFGQEK